MTKTKPCSTCGTSRQRDAMEKELKKKTINLTKNNKVAKPILLKRNKVG